MADITPGGAFRGGAAAGARTPGAGPGAHARPTAVLISLFTDRRAEPSDVIPDAKPGQAADRRGWWGDLDQDYPIGSRLWLLSRAKQVSKTLQDAQAYCTEALAWMIADGVAASTAVTCTWLAQGAIGITINLYRQNGAVLATYAWAWNRG